MITASPPYKVIKFAADITEQWLAKASSDAQLEALHSAQAVIEFDLGGNVLNANQLCLATIGYTSTEIVGRHHSMFVEAAERTSRAYTDHWNRLKAGNFVNGLFSRIGKAGNIIWIQASYIPIKSPSGETLRITKYASNVTQRIEDDLSLKRLLEEAADVMGSMAQGDLTRRMTGSYTAPLNSLSTAINDAIAKISVVISHIIDSGETLNASTIAAAVEEQRAVSADISRTINETSEGTRQIAASFNQVMNMAYESLTVTDKGQEASEQLTAMAAAFEQVIGHFKLDANLRAPVKRKVDAGRGGTG